MRFITADEEALGNVLENLQQPLMEDSEAEGQIKYLFLIKQELKFPHFHQMFHFAFIPIFNNLRCR